jgi:hypothetical protein
MIGVRVYEPIGNMKGRMDVLQPRKDLRCGSRLMNRVRCSAAFGIMQTRRKPLFAFALLLSSFGPYYCSSLLVRLTHCFNSRTAAVSSRNRVQFVRSERWAVSCRWIWVSHPESATSALMSLSTKSRTLFIWPTNIRSMSDGILRPVPHTCLSLNTWAQYVQSLFLCPKSNDWQYHPGEKYPCYQMRLMTQDVVTCPKGLN